MFKLLIIDDEKDILNMLSRLLELEGYEVHKAKNIQEGKEILNKKTINVILTDVKLPEGNVTKFIEDLKYAYPETEIICLTAYGNITDGVQAMKNGAFDYLVKGDDNKKIIPLLSKACEKSDLQFKISRLHSKIQGDFGFDKIIGHSKAIQEVTGLAKKVAPMDTSVMLTGETGTGKEVFAKAIHAHSPRKSKQFLAINCSALSPTILESELFGHKAGAFTGAQKDKRGLLEEADKGTLFLDEIGEMEINLQAKILRFLEEGTFIKIGDSKETKVDVRIISATHRDLKEQVADGKFREDLFYRLSVFNLDLPSLNVRTQDIEALATHFIEHFNLKSNKRVKGISPEFLKALKDHNWKGNIRELRNIIERAIILSDQNILQVDLIPLDFLISNTKRGHPNLTLKEVEKDHILDVFASTGNNKTRTAELLGIGLTTLYRKLEEYQIL